MTCMRWNLQCREPCHSILPVQAGVHGWRLPCMKRQWAGYARLEETVRARTTIILMRIIINEGTGNILAIL